MTTPTYDACARASLAGARGLTPQIAQSTGGCQPAMTHNLRATTSGARLSCNAATVARPVGVKPVMMSPSGVQAKCSLHTSWRGLKRRTFSPVSGSSAATRIALIVVTERAGEPEVVLFGGSAERFRDKVLQIHRRACDLFRGQAVATAPARLCSYSLAERPGNICSAHAFGARSEMSCPRCLSSTAAWARMSMVRS